MSKLLVTVSAIGLMALIALPGAASAREQTESQTALSMKTSNSIEVSSARRHRHYRHVYRHRYYRPYGYYGGAMMPTPTIRTIGRTTPGLGFRSASDRSVSGSGSSQGRS